MIRRIALAALIAVAGAHTLDAAGDTRIIDAVRARDARAVSALLAQKVDVNTAQPDGATALHWAVEADDVKIVSLLLSAGARVDAANDYGVTPLALAAGNGSAPMIELLLGAGANPGIGLPTGETPLMTAARTGNVLAVRLLLARGANVNAREQARGQTALMWAVAERHHDVVAALVEAGADVRARSETGYTPLTFAARTGDLALGRLLIGRGADVDAAATDGTSVLHVAVVRGQVPFAELLLDHDANPNVDAVGYTPLHWAVGRWDTITSKDYQVASGEWSALAGVPAAEKMRLVKALIAHGANVNARTSKSPPRLGFGNSSRTFDSTAEIGATPYLYAAMGGEADIMRVLVANGADPTLASTDGSTALMLAAGLRYLSTENDVPESRYLAAAKVALDLGADVNAANAAGNTALHTTAWSGFTSITTLLVEHGASLELKNKVGETPLKVADGTFISQQVWFQKEVAALLRKYGAK